jgi:hypothetical protein
MDITQPLNGISAWIVSMNRRFALHLRIDDALWGCFIPGNKVRVGRIYLVHPSHEAMGDPAKPTSGETLS